MQKKEMPIGFFDSGVGGLSVLRHALSELPNESFIFYGDDLNAPYGTKSEDAIKELSLACCKFLYEKGVKAIVMACNTATSASVKMARETFGLPVISIEPAVKPAYENRKDGKILVMATPATISQTRYKELCRRVGCEDYVINVPCRGLAELLENGDFDNCAVREYIYRKLEPIREEKIDGIVIGCTHYSFISDQIKEVASGLFGGMLAIYDGMYGTVRQLKRVLQKEDLLRQDGKQNIEFYSSKKESIAVFKKIMCM